MRYAIAILLPPLAVLMCAKPFSAALNVLLTLCFWIPGVLHAWLVIAADKAQARHNSLLREQRKQTKILRRAV